MVRFHYHVFGLHLCTNRAVPGLVAVRCPLQADTMVTFVENGAAFPLQKVTRTWFASPAQSTGRPPNVIVWMDETAHSFRFRYADGAEFMLDGKGHHIWAASDSADVET